MRSFPWRVLPLLSLLCLFPKEARSQTYYITGNDPDFDPYTQVPCQLGDGFVAKADTTGIVVWLVGNDAQNHGKLYFMNPRTGVDRFLFENQDETMKAVRIDLGKFPKGAPIVFKYVNENDPPKYSGLNEPGTYDFNADPLLRTFAINGRPKPVSQETNDHGDHRWAISGRVNPREVVFAFDDVANGDHDYNDVVFIVSGVALNSEVKLAKPDIAGTGNFDPNVNVRITPDSTSEPPIILYYTVDGTDPSLDTATGLPLGTTRIHTAPFDITDETTIIARSWKKPYVDEGGGVRTYLPSDTALKVFSPLRLAVKAAVYLDESGDGRIDAARLVFDARPPRMPPDISLQSPIPPGALLSLPQSRFQASPAPGDSAVLLVRFADQPFPFGTAFPEGPYGRFPTATVMFGSAPFNIRDSVGPVIVKADALRDAANPASRALRVVFSEPVTADLASRAFPHLLKRVAGADPNAGLALQEVRKVGDNTVDYVFTPASSAYPIPGDSIRALPHAALRDARGTASNMGYFVPIGGEMESQPIAIVRAAYLDEDGDGHIDAARITFGMTPPALPGSVALKSPFAPNETVTLPQARFETTLDPATFTVRFRDQDFGFGTGFAESALGSIPAGPPIILYRPEAYVLRYPVEPFLVRDSAGPVIVKAEARREGAAGEVRVLRVTFSEPVLADAASKAFPYDIKRAVGADPDGQMPLGAVTPVDGKSWDYVFVANTPLYPVPGDSIKLLAHPALADAGGVQGNMGRFVPVTGSPDLVNMDLVVKGGGWVGGATLVNPQPLLIPVSVVPGGVHVQNAPCLDCKDPTWKARDPSRPGVFPIGPLISVATQAPFAFDLAFYTNLGGFVNRAQGEVTEVMLRDAPLDSLGRKVVSLMWYPVSPKGHQAGTGAYVAKGRIDIASSTRQGSQGEKITVVGRRQNVSVTVGYMRR